MDISSMITFTPLAEPQEDDHKLPWDEANFSQRMLHQHLSQDNDWASRRQPVIDQHITWISSQLPPEARILDLGCGPGLYTLPLARMGYQCTGVDFSPASIAYARRQERHEALDITYVHQDMRHFSPAQPFDFIMMTFGELNTFSVAEVRHLLRQCAQWLVPGGKLLIEVHTFDEVKRQGQAAPGWQRCPQGLFLAEPHLLLTENEWDDATSTSLTRYWAIDHNGKVTRFGSQMSAWQEQTGVQWLEESGFHDIQRLPVSAWSVSDTFAGKLYPLLATRT
ncbi:methyltransferase domain-containing protein [Shimwellia pseudoproteus]|nr:methyltransferase domain-containing protein [Shimwellia pseudoproteus]